MRKVLVLLAVVECCVVALSQPAFAEIYVQADALWLELEQESFLFGTIGLKEVAADDAQYEPGFRLTMGVRDSCSAVEMSYFGTHQWSDERRIVGGGRILSPFTASGNRGKNELTSLTRNSELHNVELDYRHSAAWDFGDVSTGVRYVSFDEEFNLLTRSTVGEDYHYVGTQNDILALQLGVSCQKDFSWLTAALVAEGGVGVNFLSGAIHYEDTRQGLPATDRADDNELSFTTYVDVQFVLSRDITDWLTVRCGCQGMVINGLALSGDLLDRNRRMLDQGQAYWKLVTPYQGSMILHGGWIGFEIHH